MVIKKMQNRIKILYLITDLNIGGAELVLYRLLVGINKQKFEPVVVSIVTFGGLAEKIKELGINVFTLNARNKLSPIPFLKFIKILKKEKPLILNSFLFHADILGRLAGRICGVSIVISSIRSEKISKLREIILRYTQNLCDIVVSVSSTAAQKAISSKMIAKKKLRIIVNGIDINRFGIRQQNAIINIEELKNISRNKTFVAVGNLREAKGYPYLIEAAQIIKSKYPDIRVVIIGEGEKREELQQDIDKRGLKDSVLLLGQKNNVADYLAMMDFFVLPSLWEGMPNTLLEAMASGLICIGTKVSGVAEIIQDKENGFLVMPGDAKGLASKMINLINLSEEEKEKIKILARKTIVDNFSTEKMINEYQILYYEQIKTKNILL